MCVGKEVLDTGVTPAKTLTIVATRTTAEDAGVAHCRPGECCELGC